MFDLLISFLTNTGYFFIAQDVRYLIMIVVLMVRPYGMFGTKEVVRV